MSVDVFEIIELLKKEDNFVITSHISPDGDNIGSIVALCNFLKKIDKKVVIVLDDDIPENLLFLLNIEKIIKSEQFSFYEDYHLIALDSAEKNRISISEDIINNAKKVLNIDHHISNTNYGDFNYVVSNASSTCEVILNILRLIDEDKITSDIATSIYTGISTDTGNFLFSSAGKNTFLSASFLIEKGADRELIANEIYRNVTLNQRNLIMLALETLEVRDDIAIMVIDNFMLEKSSVEYKDAELLTNIPIDTKGVKIGIVIKQKNDKLYKLSFRSKENINVCEIAKQFDGGGHVNASGGTFEGELKDLKDKLFEISLKQLKRYE